MFGTTTLSLLTLMVLTPSTLAKQQIRMNANNPLKMVFPTGTKPPPQSSLLLNGAEFYDFPVDDEGKVKDYSFTLEGFTVDPLKKDQPIQCTLSGVFQKDDEDMIFQFGDDVAYIDKDCDDKVWKQGPKLKCGNPGGKNTPVCKKDTVNAFWKATEPEPPVSAS